MAMGAQKGRCASSVVEAVGACVDQYADCLVGFSVESGERRGLLSAGHRPARAAPPSLARGQCRGSGQPSAHDPSPASNPPSASNTLPVIRFAIGDTQNRMTRAMSSGAPARPSRLAAAAPETSIPAAVSTSA